MKTDDVYQFFGSARRASEAIGVTRSAFYKWMDRGYIPFKQQVQFELITKGKLVACKDEDSSDEIYLPRFRFYDKKYGMCEVDYIQFRKDKPPKITYLAEGKKITSFTTETLCQASYVIDAEGNLVYEGDICLLKNKEKFIFKDMEMLPKLKKLGKFKIVGNVFGK